VEEERRELLVRGIMTNVSGKQTLILIIFEKE